ncbi:MAG: hypothetical protein A2571_02705 [Candidatus Vogelbacteria bacterium RIFOXYD1_FULL_44_32]|uniref:Uncharacterized protein n=1 Tax=Candidatus Vogelbacteria bacterium RIFOXYD1_FULL_44_32 TaxID=1802438 RepID=A0A1G2QDJ2_9BACT|nr:MAG: hypothetical protein A2571_02705 [Candidatus Vogelbacteria bacterium RIFOXYD1_FULL_44_32]
MPEDGRPSLTERATTVLMCGEDIFVNECELRLRPPEYMGYDVGCTYPYVAVGTSLFVILYKGISNGTGIVGIVTDEIIPTEGLVTVRLLVPNFHHPMVYEHATAQNGWVQMAIEKLAVA